MSIHLLVAPAASGKTWRCIQRLKQARAASATAPIWACLPNHLQVSAFRARLAQEGGLLGIRTGTFDALYRELLAADPDEARPELREAAQVRILRGIVEAAAREGRLPHYGPIADRPGFIRALQSVIRELKAARIAPQDLLYEGAEPPQRELAALYAAYQAWLEAHRWNDEEELGWQVLDALERRPELGRDWALLLVDGFDHLDEVQLQVVSRLGQRVGELCMTLSGQEGAPRLAHRRFDRARRELESRLALAPVFEREADPALAGWPAAFVHLERHLFDTDPSRLPYDGESLTFLEATDPPTEAREALRWLKARLVQDGLLPCQVALLARDLGPYRPYLREAAAEFGLPLRLVDQDPLLGNPCIDALSRLLMLAELDWPWRLVVEAWGSPYFDWGGLGIAIEPGDADRLAAAARWGQVVEGQDNWREILARLTRPPVEGADEEEDRAVPFSTDVAERLLGLWDSFAREVTPMPEADIAGYIGWIEDLVGPLEGEEDEPEGAPSLRLGRRVREVDPRIRRRDESALRAFKDVLRGLWLAAAVSETAEQPMPYASFWAELQGALAAASYALSEDEAGAATPAAILAADAHQARGLSFEAVALIGLAEGLFPQPRHEDPLLPDAVRERLAAVHGALRGSTESDEPTVFYEAATRARRRLLLTRPRLAEDGAPWEPSPFWEAVRDLFTDSVVETVLASQPRHRDAASPSELLLALAAAPEPPILPPALAADWRAVAAGAEIWRARRSPDLPTPYEGDASALAGQLAARYGPAHIWSTSRLETFGCCPFSFYIQCALGLEPVMPPQEGLDVAQLGTLYHRLLEACYSRARPDYSLPALLEALAQVAPAELQAAPERYGFRPTGWWALHQEEVQREVEATLRALDALGGYAPAHFELAFGFGSQPPLVLEGLEGVGDALRVRGRIDRVDSSPEGDLRIIDYKAFGSGSTITGRHLLEGRRLQLPLYALAAEEALGLGRVRAGFYWHIRKAEPSSLKLEGYGDSPQDAARQACEHARRYVASIRAGAFPPQPLSEGCPDYCPAAAFCWRYRPSSHGS